MRTASASTWTTGAGSGNVPVVRVAVIVLARPPGAVASEQAAARAQTPSVTDAAMARRRREWIEGMCVSILDHERRRRALALGEGRVVGCRQLKVDSVDPGR